jgi:hypothetical protein
MIAPNRSMPLANALGVVVFACSRGIAAPP